VLHDVVQAAMGWCNQHLWELRQGKQHYRQPIPGDNGGGSPTMKTDKIRLGDPELEYPRHVTGERAARA
jgi:hypothetical protein